MCIDERPVCTTRAVTSTSSPTSTGRVNRTFPTYAVTAYVPLQPAAAAYPALSIHSSTRPAETEPDWPASVGAARKRRVISAASAAGLIAPFCSAGG